MKEGVNTSTEYPVDNMHIDEEEDCGSQSTEPPECVPVHLLTSCQSLHTGRDKENKCSDESGSFPDFSMTNSPVSGQNTPIPNMDPYLAFPAGFPLPPLSIGMPNSQMLVCSTPPLGVRSPESSLMLPNIRCNYDSKSNLSETGSAVYSICRICHMPEDESEMLISPCRCAGTMQFIHNACLQKWLEIKTKKTKKPPKCELCHFQYHRHKKFKFHHWRFPRVSQQDKVLHVIFIINLIIMVACAIATVMCFLSDKGKIAKFPRNTVDLTTEEIITLSCGVLFFVSFFIAMSVQIKAKHTIYQLFVKFIMQNMEWEIDEYDKNKDSLFSSMYKGAPSCV